MSKAYKCDRCGALFSETRSSGDYFLANFKKGVFEHTIDLCDECLDDLDLFMKGQPVKKPGDKSWA